MASKEIDFNNYVGGEEALANASRALRALGKESTALAQSVANDAGRITAGFDKIAAAVKEVQANGGKLNLTSDADKKLLQDYIKQVGDLKKAKEDLKATEAAQATLQRGLTDATKQYTTELARQKDALRAAAAAKDEAGQKAAAAAIRTITLETTQLSKALRGTNSEFTAAKGSYDALVIENNKLLASLTALEGGLNSGSQEALKLKKQIFDNTETLKIFDDETNRAFRRVGSYAQSFQGLVTELAKARTAQAAMTIGSLEYQQQQQRIIGFQTAAQKSAAGMGLSYEQAEAKIEGATAAIQPLVTSLVRLEKEQDAVALSAGRESEAFRKIGFQIEGTKKQLGDAAKATEQVGGAQSNLTQQLGFSREGLQQFAIQAAASAIGLSAILAATKAVFEANVEYSRELAEVRKTTGLTADEADRLGVALKGLDTPTSIAGLLKIASVGGQLGIAKGELLGFTQSIDTAVQALGNDFSGGAEEIATVLGKIGNVYRKELGPDTAQNILSIGSAVNELGAVGAATAPFLTDVALRVGALSASTGVGLKNTLAYAAVLEETGSTAEVAGTSLSRLYSTLATKSKEAYEIAKLANPALTLKEFTRLVNTDFNQAIQVFLKGLNAGGTSTIRQAELLKTLKLQSGEAKAAIVTLAQNTELFAERQKTANDQLRDGTSLAKEAAINTDTLAGSVDKTTNSFKNFFTSGAGSSFLKFLVDTIALLYSNTIGNVLTALGNGLDTIKLKLGVTKPALEDYTVAVVGNITALTKQAAAGQALLDSYTKLRAATQRSAADELELAQLREKLVKLFGTDSEAAIQKTIDGRKQRAANEKQGLEDQLRLYTDYVGSAQKAAADAQQALTDAQTKASLTAEQVARARQIAGSRLATGPLTGKSAVPELEPAIAAARRLSLAEKDLAEQLRIQANLRAALAKLQGPATKAVTGDDPTIAADKKKVKSLADVLRAELELQKFRLQQQAKEYDRQADNVANSDEVRTRAIEKAIAIRQQLAHLDELEEIHASELKNAKLVNGEKALAFDRVRINEQYLAKVAELDFAGKRAIVALKQATADQLAEIDKQQLDTEVKALETIGADEANSAAERQQALLDASARRIEIILIESNIKRRTAKGDAEVLRKIQAEEDAAIDAELKKTRNPNADLANADLDKKYKASQLALEKSRQTGLFTEKQYYAAAVRLEDAYLAKKLENLQKDVTKQKEAADLELEINRRKNEQKTKQERDAAEKRTAIISYSLQQVQGFGDAYFAYGNQQRQTESDNLQHNQEQALKKAGDNLALQEAIKEEYRKKELAARIKAAKAEKVQALFSIALSTAQGVMSVLKTGGGTSYADFGISAALLSAFVIAQGLAAVTAVVAKPLPSFYKGRRGGEAIPFAEVAERGPEIIHEKTTNTLRYVATPSITALGKGDDVYTADETRRILAGAASDAQQMRHPLQLGATLGAATAAIQAGRMEGVGAGSAKQLDAIERAMQQNTAAMKSLKQVTVNVNGDVTGASITEGNSLRATLNRRLIQYGG